MLRAFLTNRITWALTGLLVLAVLLPIGLGRSQAAFVAGSTNPGSVFSSAASFNTVAVTLTDPGTPLRGTVMLNAVATSDRGIGTVVFQTSPAGANTWTTVCTDNAHPLQLQLGHDRASPTACATSARSPPTRPATPRPPRSPTAASTTPEPTATTTNPGSPLTGTVSVTGVGSDCGSGVANTTVQYRP